MEYHPPDRHSRLQQFHEVPADRLSLPILVGRDEEFIRLPEGGLQAGDHPPLAATDHIEGLEVLVDLDAEPGPLLILEFGGDLRRRSGEVAEVAHARLYPEPLR